MSNADRTVEQIQALFPEQVLSVENSAGQPFVCLKREKAKDVLTYLRHDAELSYDMLIDVTSLDYLNQGSPERFAVVYQLLSLKSNSYFRIKVFVPEGEPWMETVSDLWKAASWAEREVFDLMGIEFKGHPDLRRLVLPEYYSGHPLRKDYPLRGMGERENFPKYVGEANA